MTQSRVLAMTRTGGYLRLDTLVFVFNPSVSPHTHFDPLVSPRFVPRLRYQPPLRVAVRESGSDRISDYHSVFEEGASQTRI